MTGANAAVALSTSPRCDVRRLTPLPTFTDDPLATRRKEFVSRSRSFVLCTRSIFYDVSPLAKHPISIAPNKYTYTFQLLQFQRRSFRENATERHFPFFAPSSSFLFSFTTDQETLTILDERTKNLLPIFTGCSVYLWLPYLHTYIHGSTRFHTVPCSTHYHRVVVFETAHY